jgi:inorganic phosphate transporter, PiT family
VAFLLIAAVALLSFANGANDNFKGVATLWGAGRTSYRRALAWATGFTLLGSLVAVWAASGLAVKFNGSKLVAHAIYGHMPFLVAVALAAAGTVLLASRLGLPVSTTHALTGALVGAGVAAAGLSHVKFAALGSGVVLPLLFSPLVAMVLTLATYPLVTKLAGSRDCVCVDQPELVTVAAGSSATMVSARPAVRWAPSAECRTGAEAVRFSITDSLHWLSGAAISFARGLNDTPKITAVLLVPVSGLVSGATVYVLVALAIALGGALGAARVARTISQEITPMATPEAVGANLVAASLVVLASFVALPVSTTHITSGGLFGIGLLRRNEADWRRVREILLSWLATLPLGAALAADCYWLLSK